MQAYEYRAVPAPRRGVKVKGVRGEEARFAAAVEGEMNRMAAEGWDYVRSDTLPCEERQGWFGGRVTVSRTLLVFRRAAAGAAAAMPPRAAASVVPPLAAPPLAAGPRPTPYPPEPEPDPEPGEPPLPGPGDPPVAARPLGPAPSPLHWVTGAQEPSGARPSGAAGGRREPPLVAE